LSYDEQVRSAGGGGLRQHTGPVADDESCDYRHPGDHPWSLRSHLQSYSHSADEDRM